MFSEIKVLGVFGAMLMVLLGIWVSTTGIYYKSGEVNAGNNTIITSVSNTTNTTTISTYVNSTILNTYDTVQVPGVSVIGVPGAEAKTIIGIVVIGLGLFALIYYSRIFTRWK